MKTIKSVLIFFAAAFLILSCKKQPEAGFTVNDDTPYSGQTLTFTNTTVDGDRFEWTFGDGATSFLENPTHTYLSQGTYTVKLKAYSKKDKKEDEYSMTLNVEATTAQKLTGYWSYDSLIISSYVNGEFSSRTVSNLDDTYDVHTINFNSNFTYMTQFDAETSTGNWGVVAEGETFSIDSDTASILSLTSGAFHFVAVDNYSFGGDDYLDSIAGFMSR